MLFSANIFTNDKSESKAQIKIGKELNKKLHPSIIVHTRFNKHHTDKSAFMDHNKELAKAGYKNEKGYVDRKESKAILAMRDFAQEIGFAEFEHLITFKFDGFKNKKNEIENKIDTLSHILIAGKRAYIFSVDLEAEDKKDAPIKLGKRRKNVVVGKAILDETKDGNPFYRVMFNSSRQDEIKPINVDMKEVMADPAFIELNDIFEKHIKKTANNAGVVNSEIEELKAQIELLKAENARLVEENTALKAGLNVEEAVSVKEMTNEEKLELAKASIKFVSFKEEKEEVKPANIIPQDIKEILLNNPSVEVWNKHVCRKYTLAPITMQDIFKFHHNDMDSWLVLKAA